MQFAGQQTDATGLEYLRARYYDPVTGTFLSSDPLGVSPAWPGNPYAYANGNPATLVNPYGLFGLPSWSDIKSGVGKVGTAIGHAATGCLQSANCSRIAAIGVFIGTTALTGGNVAAGFGTAGVLLTFSSGVQCDATHDTGACIDAYLGLGSLAVGAAAEAGYQAAAAVDLDPFTAMIQRPLVAAVNACLHYCPAIGNGATIGTIAFGIGPGSIFDMLGEKQS